MRRVSDVRGTPHKPVQKLRRAASPSLREIGRASPIACRRSCVLAPPITLKATPKFPKIPTPVLLFSSFCIRTGPCNWWHLHTAAPSPPSHASLMFPASPRRPSPILPERLSSVAAEDDNCAHRQTLEGRGCDSARTARTAQA